MQHTADFVQNLIGSILTHALLKQGRQHANRKPNIQKSKEHRGGSCSPCIILPFFTSHKHHRHAITERQQKTIPCLTSFTCNEANWTPLTQFALHGTERLASQSFVDSQKVTVTKALQRIICNKHGLANLTRDTKSSTTLRVILSDTHSALARIPKHLLQVSTT